MQMAEKMRGIPTPYLKEWRVKRLMAQGELAERAGLARATIARAEKGDEAVSFANIHKIAAALNVSVDELQRSPEGA